MKIIKCDFCGKEMKEGESVATLTLKTVESFYGNSGEYIRELDVCPTCGKKFIKHFDEMMLNQKGVSDDPE